MENTPKPTNKVALNYGIYLGIASVFLSVIIYATGMLYTQDWKVGTVNFLVMIAVIFLGIKKYKEFNDDSLTVPQALKTGIGIALIGGIIAVIYTLIFTNFIEADYMDKIMEVQQQAMTERFPDMSDEQIESQLEMVKKFSSPWMTSAFALVGSIFFGFIISLIVGFILKKEHVKQPD